jgi:AraC-like DNA-binding protein
MADARTKLDGVVRKLPIPKHYYTGITLPSNPLPDNLLVFHRGSRQEMVRYHQKATAHRRHVLVVPVKTKGQVYIDGLIYPMTPGGMILIFPFQTHRATSFEEEEITWLYLTFELSSEISEVLEPLRNRPVRARNQDFESMAQITRAFLDESGRSPRQSLEMAITLQRFLLDMAGRAESQGLTKHTGGGRQLTGTVGDACRYIDQHLHEQINAQDVAKAMGLSEVYLRKLFVRDINQPLGKHIRTTRVIKACELLATTDAPIASVARAAGFSAGDAFSRAFRTEVGVTPSQYRRKRNKVLP